MDLKKQFAIRERRQHCICFVSQHLKYNNTPALGFRAATALARLEKSGLMFLRFTTLLMIDKQGSGTMLCRACPCGAMPFGVGP
ncbi:MAG: hypothetical protein KGZ25_01915 [Planctomycetes bacterium]|nr:hypothetical protein [Planctomycetota bacterium]